MKRISVELVPRDEDALRGELALLGKFKENAGKELDNDRMLLV